MTDTQLPAHYGRAKRLLYATVLSMAYFGSAAEACGRSFGCSSRSSAVIAMGAVTTLFSIGGILISMLNVQPMMALFGVSGIAFLSNTAAVAILTSPRTFMSFESREAVIALLALLAWAAEIALASITFDSCVAALGFGEPVVASTTNAKGV